MLVHLRRELNALKVPVGNSFQSKLDADGLCCLKNAHLIRKGRSKAAPRKSSNQALANARRITCAADGRLEQSRWAL
jgi:hypothetical protein